VQGHSALDTTFFCLPNRLSEFNGLEWSTGPLDWTAGLDYWTVLLDWTTGLDYWTTGLDYWTHPKWYKMPSPAFFSVGTKLIMLIQPTSSLHLLP